MNNVQDIYAIAFLLALGWVFIFFGSFVMGIVILVLSHILAAEL